MTNLPRYRVWDKQRKQYVESRVLVLGLGDEPILAYNTKQGLYPIPDTSQKDLGLDRFVIEQWTGLKDSSGREIYCGDILLFPSYYRTGLDKYHDAVCVVAYDIREARFSLKEAGNQPFRDLWMASSHKIIGNIHQNPDLLTNHA